MSFFTDVVKPKTSKSESPRTRRIRGLLEQKTPSPLASDTHKSLGKLVVVPSLFSGLFSLHLSSSSSSSLINLLPILPLLSSSFSLLSPFLFLLSFSLLFYFHSSSSLFPSITSPPPSPLSPYFSLLVLYLYPLFNLSFLPPSHPQQSTLAPTVLSTSMTHLTERL